MDTSMDQILVLLPKRLQSYKRYLCRMGNVIFILQIKKSGWRRPNGDVAVINALSSKLMLFSIHPTWFNLLILFHEMKQL